MKPINPIYVKKRVVKKEITLETVRDNFFKMQKDFFYGQLQKEVVFQKLVNNHVMVQKSQICKNVPLISLKIGKPNNNTIIFNPIERDDEKNKKNVRIEKSVKIKDLIQRIESMKKIINKFGDNMNY